MYQPLGFRGELVIATRFGLLSAESGAWGLPVEALMMDPEWVDLICLDSGPFFLTDFEREIPF